MEWFANRCHVLMTRGTALVRRRDFLKALSCLSAATLWPALRRLAAALQAPDTPKTLAFSASDVQRQARALAAEKFVPPKLDLPRQWQELGYEQYRGGLAIWNSKGEWLWRPRLA